MQLKMVKYVFFTILLFQALFVNAKHLQVLSEDDVLTRELQLMQKFLVRIYLP